MRPAPSALALVLSCALAFACSKPSAPPPASSSTPSASAAQPAPAPPSRTADKIQTSSGELQIFPLHHATFFLSWQGATILVDPYHEGNFEGVPKADILVVTHDHFDHFDESTIATVVKPTTLFIAPPAVASKLSSTYRNVVAMKNGDTRELAMPFPRMTIEAVPAYNLVRGPGPGKLYHDKGSGNGYVFTFGDKRLYVSGDTECTPEMKALKNVDVAFVCMNLPYTMGPPEAADCVKAFRPKIVYPYHYRGQSVPTFVRLMSDAKDVEVRSRDWY